MNLKSGFLETFAACNKKMAGGFFCSVDWKIKCKNKYFFRGQQDNLALMTGLKINRDV